MHMSDKGCRSKWDLRQDGLGWGNKTPYCRID